MKKPMRNLPRSPTKISRYYAVIGVDEVGMGSLAGPVVVCAVQVPPRWKIGDFGVRDSKSLTAKQRETIAATLSFPHYISWCYPKTIDTINIFQAARKAMWRAVQKLRGNVVFVDGPHKIPKLSIHQVPVVKGDSTVFAIACASIIAKVHRDRMMTRYARRFPQYGFERHKGYGTKLHYAMLYQYGPCALHRKSFTLYP